LPEHKSYAEIAVALPISKPLTYRVPDILRPHIAPGKRVLVPVKNTSATGYTLACVDHTVQEQVKDVIDVLDSVPVFPASMVPFFRWIADYYLHPIGEVLRAALPGGLNPKPFQAIELSPAGRHTLETPEGLNRHRRQVLDTINRLGPTSEKALIKALDGKIGSKTLREMEKSGLVTVKKKIRPGRTQPKKALFVRASEKPRVPPSGLSQTRQRILDYLSTHEAVPLRTLKGEIPGAGRLARKMADAGLLELFEQCVYRDPFGEPIESETNPHQLTGEQSAVLKTITRGLSQGFKTYLLHGVTGSGKTEVYMHAVSETLKQGRQALVLVPEIALISQTERRFRARFGDCVALLHSGLSAGEHFDQWMRIVEGKAKIAIGARSAIFAPFENPGLFIVDEEHDESYKQESTCRYNARDLAVVRAKQQDAIAVLGSATPSLQSYYNVMGKKFHGLTLNKRIEDRDMARVTVVDLRPKTGSGRAKPLITDTLKTAIEETLARKEQILLFLNRRGFANCPACLSCGAPVRCKYCEVTMTLHRQANAYKCHYCGHTAPHTAPCRVCGNAKIIPIGTGTEKVQAKIEALFPQARVDRMDRDTTRRKGSLVKILRNLKEGATDILIGTQMVAKGHHYPNITLVGILCADLSLNFPDFRSGERTFQLLAQVAGRAGRGERPGRVILQTFNPDHFCITTAKDQDYRAYFNQEIGFRQSALYPPFCRLMQVIITGRDKSQTARYARRAGQICREVISDHPRGQHSIQLLGPVTAPLSRIKDRYRWQLLLKGTRVDPLHQVARTLRRRTAQEMPRKGNRLIIDVDPMNML